ncbi:MAG TPA: HAD family hydrolase [Acidobacteriota bacterium]|nr:HAD family hydrolase [Acidobacteriota bacterium]
MARLIVGDKTIECKLIIFDKDGTLINQHLLLLELARARKNSIKKHVGKEVAELWEKAVGVDLKKDKIDHSGPLATAPRREELLVAATAFYSSGFSWDEAKQVARMAYDYADSRMTAPYGSILLEGAAETLKRLKKHGFKLAIASTDTHKRTEESFKALKMFSLFDAIVGSDEVTDGKPSPDMIFEVLRRTNSKLHETVIVGDSVLDMQMGVNAKVKACVGVLTGFTSKKKLQQLTDVVISSIAELRVA